MSSTLITCRLLSVFFFFFFNDTATTEIYTLSLHDALPIWAQAGDGRSQVFHGPGRFCAFAHAELGAHRQNGRSEEHTSELQSPCNLVCRLLLEKKKNHQIVRLILFSTAILSHLYTYTNLRI